ASQAPALTATFDWFHNLATGGAPVAATPSFTPASGTSFSSTLSVSIADTTPSASIYYTTDGSTPTTSSQLYSGPFTISASTKVNAIATATGYTESGEGSASYTYSPVVSGTPVSDDYNAGSLNGAQWQVAAPVGGSAAVSNGELVLTVPGGSNHDAAVPALDAVQVIQPVSNTNFDVAVKIDSTLVAANKYYGQGLMVEGDAKNYIRFELGAGGTSVNLSAGTVINGAQATKFQISPFTSYAVPTYLRLTRVGTTYTAYWSTNGTTWNQAGSFTDTLVVTGLAPYAWNYSTTPSQAPALTATFDWFHNLTTGP
ncbi:MAG TPA: chitobiase/beta-hexosaminidase C-terminal domain-containing protein, partial [Acidobacteriaceae bacterium]|nr:chitobiase/beta-hexosaminidase C-terminal domain-containing protein [Acidobacteriaceae bacterium]